MGFTEEGNGDVENTGETTGEETSSIPDVAVIIEASWKSFSSLK